MTGYLKTVLIAALCALLGGVVVAAAQRTNYLGTVFIADTTTPSNQLKVNSDGSINVDATGGGGGNPSTHNQCGSLCSSLVVKNAAGNLYSFHVSADSTLSGAAWWIMVYDLTSAPADGSVTPAKCYALPSGATAFTGAFDAGGVAFTTGITIGVSTTGCFTKTASAHAFIGGDYQ
jgi:hypothetical protein